MKAFCNKHYQAYEVTEGCNYCITCDNSSTLKQSSNIEYYFPPNKLIYITTTINSFGHVSCINKIVHNITTGYDINKFKSTKKSGIIFSCSDISSSYPNITNVVCNDLSDIIKDPYFQNSTNKNVVITAGITNINGLVLNKSHIPTNSTIIVCERKLNEPARHSGLLTTADIIYTVSLESSYDENVYNFKSNNLLEDFTIIA